MYIYIYVYVYICIYIYNIYIYIHNFELYIVRTLFIAILFFIPLCLAILYYILHGIVCKFVNLK